MKKVSKMSKASFRNWGCRIKDDIKYKGFETVFLENEFLKVGILIGKGSDIFEFLYKPKDMDFIWLSPSGIRDPSHFALTKEQPSGRFMDYYEGGWQEIFPNGGGLSEAAGATLGQHEEVSLLPWELSVIEDTKEKVEICLSVRTRLTPFFIKKKIKLEKDNPSLMIKEEIINESAIKIQTIWGHHLAYGYPFLEQGTKIIVSASKCKTYDVEGVLDDDIPLAASFDWPDCPLKDGSFVDLSVIPVEKIQTSKFLYLSGIKKGEYEIINNSKNLKIKVEWDKDIMPYLWFWQEFHKTDAYPWYKRARVFGLEPFSTDIMGLENTIKGEKALQVKGNSKIEFYMNLSVLEI
jgi:hypothetical protein